MANYPIAFSVDYPDRKLNRLSTAFRLFAAIPIVILAALLQGSEFGAEWELSWFFFAAAIPGVGIVTLPTALMILVRRKYPRWWYEWNLELQRFGSRIVAYLALMDDRYPSTDEQQAVHLDFAYPDATELSRGLPVVKWLLAIPHYVVLIFLYLGAAVAVIGAWLAILFTGRYPEGIFRFVEGVLRWSNRVTGYAYTLVTDRYPPFRLSA